MIISNYFSVIKLCELILIKGTTLESLSPYDPVKIPTPKTNPEQTPNKFKTKPINNEKINKQDRKGFRALSAS